jgi:hypothetical protein
MARHWEMIMIATGWGRLGLSALIVTMATAAGRAAEDPKSELVRTATLEVVDQDNSSPLVGATVWVQGLGGPAYTREGTTDARGRYTIVSPSEATRSFNVVIAPAGHERRHLAIAAQPAAVIVKLRRAVAIGGFVRDERGRPVEGARVLPMVNNRAPVWPEIASSPNSGRIMATTDARGLWRIDALPVGSRPDVQVWVRVMHPDHATSESRTAAWEARAFSSVQMMRTGVSISGTVLSPFGRPVAGASVAIGTAAPWGGTTLRLTTDKDGEFRSGRCLDPEARALVLLVQATGLAWSVQHIPMTVEGPPHVIRLTRRRPLEGRVVDREGRPVAGIRVRSDPNAFGGLLAWEALTDPDGRFVWYDAPTIGKVFLDIDRPPFPPTSIIIPRPGEGEVTITLHRD